MNLWKCPKCGRKFRRMRQSHSCKPYPIFQHFQGKEIAKELFNELKLKTRRITGPFRVESLNCCIHFASSFTFAAIYARTDKIGVAFVSKRMVKGPRIIKSFQISPNKYQHIAEIKSKNEIDRELLGWIKQAYLLGEK